MCARPLVELFCDGACLGNPGPGGWAFLLRSRTSDGVREKDGGGAEERTTNNRMELRGAIEGLRALQRPCDVRLRCDSQYVVKGIEAWLAKWKARGWRRADGKPVLNEDLWRELDGLLETHNVEAAWVKGHAGHAENELVDAMALKMAKTAKTGATLVPSP
jgi:ribonuclease HI